MFAVAPSQRSLDERCCVKPKRKISGENGTFDGEIPTVHIPMTWNSRGGRKVIIVPAGSDAWVPAKPRPDETLIRAQARAHRCTRLLEEGTDRSATELAEAERITGAYITRLLKLKLLAPDIAESVLEGRQAKGITVAQLTHCIPACWRDQRTVIACHHASKFNR